MRSVQILGIRVDGWNLSELLDATVAWLGDPTRQKKTVMYANVHVLNTAADSQELTQALHSATTVYCDGSGVRLGASLLGKSLPVRTTAADWIGSLCERLAAEGRSVFLLGGAPSVADRAAESLRQRYPKLRIAGAHHGYVGAAYDAVLIQTLNDSAADIVLVGMGTPKQEIWIARNRAKLDAPVVWAVGALFDFVAGVERRAPRWILSSHLEWLARLAANPGRQWRRYLVGNPLFVARVLRQRLRRAADSRSEPL